MSWVSKLLPSLFTKIELPGILLTLLSGGEVDFLAAERERIVQAVRDRAKEEGVAISVMAATLAVNESMNTLYRQLRTMLAKWLPGR